jgi:2-methoxy-6-polyprenyl-1,4-benzoquinol methylase
MRRVLASQRRALCQQAQSGKSTHFGFRSVPEDEKEHMVGHVFSSVASRYDIMNDVMSCGVHRVWKDMFVGMIGVKEMGKEDLQVLDVAGGTGDISFRIAHQIAALRRSKAGSSWRSDDEEAEGLAGVGGPCITVSDINKDMLENGRIRAQQLEAAGNPDTWPRMEWVTADAEQLPFDDCSFDVYTIAFGIRNVTRMENALREAKRVLRPGGRFLCLEFSRVRNPLLRMMYERYSFDVIPRMGQLVADDRASYQYLVESIQQFPEQEVFAQRIRDAGLRCVSHTNLTNGVVAVHSAIKLPDPPVYAP